MSGPALRVVITGGSGGIGRVVVERFRSAGAHVVNLDRLAPARGGTRKGRLDHVDVDLLDGAAIGKAFEAVDRYFGGHAPQVLVCAASIGMTHHVLEVTAQDIDRVMGINIRGTLLVAQAAALRMRAAKQGGRIVIVTSISAYQAWAQEPLYNISKGAQHAMVQTLAVELAPFDIRVNAVAPGVVDVKSQGMGGNRARPEVAAHYLDIIPQRRYCQPEEVAEAIWTLSHATYMTGQALTIDGGLMANGLSYIGSLRKDVLARLDKTLPARKGRKT